MPDQIERWDELVTANPDGGNVLQLLAFADTKSRHGWQPRYFMLEDTAVLVLTRHIPLLGEFWYVPKGPGVTDKSGLKRFVEVGRYQKAPFVIRFDPEINSETIDRGELAKLGLERAPRDIQYNVSTVIIDLKPSEEEILASFKQKTRYNVRLSEKKGVTFEAVPLTKEAIDTMYSLTAETTARASVYLRSRDYFADFWKLHAGSGHGQMFLARYEGKVLGGVFVTYEGKKALYKDGGSVREHSDVQAMAGLQWFVMRWLKEHGVEEYDLHGVPPKSELENPDHQLAGLARFKTGFQPEVTEYIGTWDLPLKLTKYAVWRKIGERLCVAYEYRVKKRLFY